jgi:hypothetical protein
MKATWLLVGILLTPMALPPGCYSHADVGPAHAQAHRGPDGIALQLSIQLPPVLRLSYGQVQLGPAHALIVGPPGGNWALVYLDWK